ncbi:MAG: hypothetical protein AAGE96_01735 [Cyanobacteria bacterium P01_G01_bin.19]
MTTPNSLASEATFDFSWTGQIAGFSVLGQFSYDDDAIPTDGIVREEDLLSFDISFYEPNGNLLRTYLDNHLTFPEFNFAYDTNTGEVLTDGIFTEPDGINVGEKTAVGDGFTGLNLWSKSKPTSSSLIHIDDWSDEFGYPLGYSTHEDIAFLTQTTQQLIDTGKVGETYLDSIQDSLDELGEPIQVTPTETIAGSFVMIPDSVRDRILLFDANDGSLVDDNFIDGSDETGLGIFTTPLNAIQVDDEIWVSDQVADSIFRFDLQGNYINRVDDSDFDGDTDGLDNIRGIEFVDGLVYVSNSGDGNDAPGDGEVVVVFDTEGNNLGFFDTGDPFDIKAYNGELLITDVNRDSDGGEDIDRYSINGVDSTFLGTFVESDGETGIDFPQQITLRESNGNVLVGGFSRPGGIYEYDSQGNQVDFFDAEDGFANIVRAAYELGNGKIIWSGGDGVIVTDPNTGEDIDIYTVNNQDFRPGARYIEPLIIPNEINGTDGNDTLQGIDSVDIIHGGAGADRITANGGDDIVSGGDNSDRITGNDGNDSIFGGADADLINGNAGDDLLSGDAGNDEIRGGAGDDLLMGVTGNDTLRGEGGSDTFVFGNGDGTDRINDFDPSEDKIGLVEGELTFADITLTQQGNNVILGVGGTGEELALLVKVSADDITEDSFVTVPDISNIDDVL